MFIADCLSITVADESFQGIVGSLVYHQVRFTTQYGALSIAI